ncbi:XRE family transcriptional regulator [Leptotrichia sp. oral taxon 223]|uniref:XRE family transcriptional regulator n=1 Tax=Leptotrichia sp. oral taxon 223 TaxID=712363 RepID=UPI0015BC5B48|nr:XRE family transcriptional regulator [Leptotrichia sp. oral taxon 223]NWO18035.1 LexA family transcriptional regulator [Leptotrichia sp. oral taxon 223]
MNIGKRLKELRKNNKLSMDTLVEKLNKEYNLRITKSMVSRWENNLSEPSSKFVTAYAKFFNVDLNYLAGITNFDSHNKYNAASHGNLIPVEITEIPMYGKASAGTGYINLSEEIGSYSIPKDIYKNGLFAIKVSGDSMNGFDKSIPDDSIAIVDPELCTNPISLNGKVCVFEYNDETYIKQLIIDKQGIIRLHSFNPDYDDIIILNTELLYCKGRVIRTFVENQW